MVDLRIDLQLLVRRSHKVSAEIKESLVFLLVPIVHMSSSNWSSLKRILVFETFLFYSPTNLSKVSLPKSLRLKIRVLRKWARSLSGITLLILISQKSLYAIIQYFLCLNTDLRLIINLLKLAIIILFVFLMIAYCNIRGQVLSVLICDKA